jgi:DUF971 family protein
VQPTFSDGHASGIYTWRYLYELGLDQDRLWAEYLEQLAEAGASREAGDAGSAAAGDGSACSRH